MIDLDKDYRHYEAVEIKRKVFTEVAFNLLPADINPNDMGEFLIKVEKISAVILIGSLKFAERKVTNE